MKICNTLDNFPVKISRMFQDDGNQKELLKILISHRENGTSHDDYMKATSKIIKDQLNDK